MPKKKEKIIQRGDPHLSETQISLEVPDEAISFIVSRYLNKKSVEGVPLVVGISTSDVETVLALFFEWAANKNYIKDGILILGGTPVG